MKHTDKELDDRIEAFMKRKADKLRGFDVRINQHQRVARPSRSTEQAITWKSLFSRRMVGA